MAETVGDDDRKRLRAAENLGWLATSGTYSKKRKLIEGVSGASVVELKAELYRAQQDAKLAQEGLLDEDRRDRRKAGIDVSGILGKGNAGVEQRSAKDDLSYKTDTDKLNDSYAALERKAVLYDRLSLGRFDDDEEQYNVDFLQKGSLSDEMPGDRHRPAYDAAEPIDTASMAIRASGMVSGDMQQEQGRRNWEEETQRRYELEQLAEADRDQRVDNMARIVEQTNQSRERAVEAKKEQQQQAAQRKDRLKADFLKKQLEQLKAAKKKPA
ncbi:hypothetical protein ABBQ38_011223 [Trebouxia sp. C0009 RCD-2024]